MDIYYDLMFCQRRQLIFLARSWSRNCLWIFVSLSITMHSSLQQISLASILVSLILDYDRGEENIIEWRTIICSIPLFVLPSFVLQSFVLPIICPTIHLSYCYCLSYRWRSQSTNGWIWTILSSSWNCKYNRKLCFHWYM